MKSVFGLVQVAAVAVAIGVASPALAVTEVMWWHAMSGQLGRQVERLAADFNASQSEYRIVPSYKGNYTQTVTAAIFAFRSRSQPAIVQVNDIATATMIAAQGAIYPVFELMRDVQHHVADEETVLLPEAEQALDKDRLSELGAQMTKRRLELVTPKAGKIAANTAVGFSGSTAAIVVGVASALFAARAVTRKSA